MGLNFPKPPAWTAQARCKDAPIELFFPRKNTVENAKDGKLFCNRCTVKNECLETALEQGNDYGIYGGLTEVERRILKQERAKEEQARLAKTAKPRRRRTKAV